jgi:hypothetical protein
MAGYAIRIKASVERDIAALPHDIVAMDRSTGVRAPKVQRTKDGAPGVRAPKVQRTTALWARVRAPKVQSVKDGAPGVHVS